jgi:NAD(P)-dependent dehydrogenase (short-subunit alcohol dehydrogenase family)
MPPAAPRVALVTGGAGLIGRAVCRHLATTGWAVVVADCNAAAAVALVAELAVVGPALAIAADVGDDTAAANCSAETLRVFGRLDLLVNNAALANPPRLPPEALPLPQWDEVLRVNLTGAFLMARYAIPALRATRGSIVNIASTRALQSEPHTEAYAAAKGGLVALTHALAISLGPAVRVNCISPGWIAGDDELLLPSDHAQHPAGRVGRAEDVAALVAFLASAEAGFITAQNYLVDGGMTRRMSYAEQE